MHNNNDSNFMISATNSTMRLLSFFSLVSYFLGYHDQLCGCESDHSPASHRPRVTDFTGLSTYKRARWPGPRPEDEHHVCSPAVDDTLYLIFFLAGTRTCLCIYVTILFTVGYRVDELTPGRSQT